MKLKAKDFSAGWGEKLSPWLVKKIDRLNLRWRPLSRKEVEDYLLVILKEVYEKKLVPAGLKRLSHWEKGWRENLVEMEVKSLKRAVIPGYFGKYPVIRWQRELIKPLSDDFEYASLAVITYWLFEKYFKEARTVYEFGCGTGHNLLRLREVNQQAELWGLDWVKSAILLIKKTASQTKDNKLKAASFDMFKPDSDFKLKKDSLVYTVASLEQLGHKFKPWVKFLLTSKVKLCVNIEPVNELLSKDNLMDYLSIKYAEKRNYLDGYLAYLHQLEKQGKIRMIQTQRTYIGSLLIDGYSVIAWSPVK